MRKKTAARVALTSLLLILSGVSGYLSVQHDPVTEGVANVDDEADSTTYITAQGLHFNKIGTEEKPGRLISVAGDGRTKWTWDDAHAGRQSWFYDVEPINNTHVFVTVSKPNRVDAVMLNTRTQTPHWREPIDSHDTHDIDYVNASTLLVAPMENDYYENGSVAYDDGVFRYDRNTDTRTWTWRYRDHFKRPDKPPLYDGWTHSNDIDRVDNDTVLVSARNFNSVLFINTTDGTIEQQLGSKNDTTTLNMQHNPDVVSLDPLTVLVADTENNRVVEYTYENGTWNRTWVLEGNLQWPRDADRLPNGNTLVTDTLNNRVIEVTPDGRVVWEYYAGWAPYDADRAANGDGSNGPPMVKINGSPTTATVHDDALGDAATKTATGEQRTIPDAATVPRAIKTATEPVPYVRSLGSAAGKEYGFIVPWVRPPWMAPASVPLFGAALFILTVWGLGEVAHRIRSE